MKEYIFGENGDSAIAGKKRQLITSSSFIRVKTTNKLLTGYIIGYIVDPYADNQKDIAVIACDIDGSIHFFEAESMEYDFNGMPGVNESSIINKIATAKSNAMHKKYEKIMGEA